MEIDQKKLEELVVKEAADQVVASLLGDDVAYRIESRVSELVDAVVISQCDAVLKPLIESEVKDFTMRTTNEFGEGNGSVTFTEYITGLAKSYLDERVNFRGEKVKRDSYDGRHSQSRLTHLLQEHLHNRIKKEMTDAVTLVVEQIAPALATTCELKVKEATDQIRRAMKR